MEIGSFCYELPVVDEHTRQSCAKACNGDSHTAFLRLLGNGRQADKILRRNFKNRQRLLPDPFQRLNLSVHSAWSRHLHLSSHEPGEYDMDLSVEALRRVLLKYEEERGDLPTLYWHSLLHNNPAKFALPEKVRV